MGIEAILSASNLPRAAAALGRPIVHLGDLLELAQRYGHTTVVVHPSAHLELDIPAQLPADDPSRRAREGIPHPFVTAALERFDVRPPGLSHFLVAHPLGSRVNGIDVHLTAYDDAAGLAELAPADTLAALRAFHDTVGAPYRWSPSAVGAALLGGGRRWGASTTSPPEPATDGATEADYHHVTPRDLLVFPAANQLYVHAFDCNGRYLSACSSVVLGLGEPEHFTPRSGDGLAFDPHLPGYWLVSTVRPFSGDYPHGPDPTDPLARHDDPLAPRWLTTPSVDVARELGALGKIHHAQLWPRHSRALAPFYATLKAAREHLIGSDQPGHAAALGMVKRTYTMTIGALAGHYREPGDPLYRPDWRHAIVATARANLTRRYVRAGLRPIAIDVDAIYCASDEPSAATFARDHGLELSTGLGAFKWAGSATMAAALEVLTGEHGLRDLGRLVKGEAVGLVH